MKPLTTNSQSKLIRVLDGWYIDYVPELKHYVLVGYLVRGGNTIIKNVSLIRTSPIVKASGRYVKCLSNREYFLEEPNYGWAQLAFPEWERLRSIPKEYWL